MQCQQCPVTARGDHRGRTVLSCTFQHLFETMRRTLVSDSVTTPLWSSAGA